MLAFLKENWSMVWAAVTVTFNVVLVLLSKTYAKRDDVELLKMQVRQLEGSLSTLPNQKELHALQLEMANLRGDLKAALPELRQLRHMSDLLLQNELKEKN
ncbi:MULTISPECIES: DUF2730 family protein [Photorhabdus]|uniref:DUF2730 domain-containing protein n=2 Tax=Photorhabdus TaxID=29487 RepID=A0A1C0TZE5_9GAMM|nr:MULTISPECIES: DUF2730 family protein [Photorhabdus]MBS9435099.1 DUF2730 family protein [Photorhabdus hainanensis]AXG42212.1 DUF2730 domain-containing protein [Photorhabdus laumondii subsp. laumondii]AXG45224.1 DUF2730 domain-containing protein [Photorhabdus laumondii subsp. laumondii]EYU13621.1 Protein of unknown function (DUF2730) [Photorhabdus aegyptia]MCC8387688.1 DUF2730 family protein [Photorhabdus laumondii]